MEGSLRGCLFWCLSCQMMHSLGGERGIRKRTEIKKETSLTRIVRVF